MTLCLLDDTINGENQISENKFNNALYLVKDYLELWNQNGQ
jgi:hypothetical protein